LALLTDIGEAIMQHYSKDMWAASSPRKKTSPFPPGTLILHGL